MTFKTIELLSIFSVFLFLFFAVYLLKVKTTKKLSNLLFAAYLITIALDSSSYFYSKFITLSPTVTLLRMEVLAGFKAPLLYLYIISLLYNNFKLKLKHSLFLLPLLINLIVLFPPFFNVSLDKQILFFENYSNHLEVRFITFFSYAAGFTFLFIGLYQIIRYRTIVKENYSDADALTNYYWLRNISIILITGTAITFTKNIYTLFHETNNKTEDSLHITLLIYTITLVSWLFSKALFAPELFKGIDVDLSLISKKEISHKDSQLTRIHQFMASEEPYLDPSLTLQKLADKLNIPSRELSILINQQIGKHFFDFINEYRIKKAMELLRETSFKKYTIQEIMYDVGFNSKTPFNTAFKKHTNLTPSQYKKTAINQNIA